MEVAHYLLAHGASPFAATGQRGDTALHLAAKAGAAAAIAGLLAARLPGDGRLADAVLPGEAGPVRLVDLPNGAPPAARGCLRTGRLPVAPRCRPFVSGAGRARAPCGPAQRPAPDMGGWFGSILSHSDRVWGAGRHPVQAPPSGRSHVCELCGRLIVQQAPDAANACAGLGLAPLHLAALKGSAATVAALLRAGAAPAAGIAGAPLGQHLSAGSTALHIAAARGHAPCASVLLDFQAALPGAPPGGGPGGPGLYSVGCPLFGDAAWSR